MRIVESLKHNPLYLLLSLACVQFLAMAQLAPLVVPALKKHTASVIWAHGLGDSYVLI